MENLNLDSLNVIFKNNKVKTVLSLLLALYAGAAAPVLPNLVINFFDTIIGKLIFTFLIAFVASRDFQIAIMIAVAFVVTLTVANNRKILEGYKNIEKFNSHDVIDAENLPIDDENQNLSMITDNCTNNSCNENCDKGNENNEVVSQEAFKDVPNPANNLNGDTSKMYAPF